MFAAFAVRLLDPKRRGIEEILKKYGLAEYDSYELLKNSAGRLTIDTYEFIDPNFPDDETIERFFISWASAIMALMKVMIAIVLILFLQEQN